MELWDGSKFITAPPDTVYLEHSLFTMSRWEAKYHEAFLTDKPKSRESILDYTTMMIVDEKHIPYNFINRLTDEHVNLIVSYIQNPSTATFINSPNTGRPNRETVTTELIYFWMVQWKIPFEAQHWHINRLLMLVQICGVKNSKPKKENMSSRLSRQAALNAKRRKAMNTSG